MPRLVVTTLGSLQVTLDGDTVTSFKSDKILALLVYLALESGHPLRRDVLAGLLWPDSPNSAARSCLRNGLSNLRRALATPSRTRADPGKPFISATRETIEFNAASDHWLDATIFRREALSARARSTSSPAPSAGSAGGVNIIASLQNALGLYAGPFLDGFAVDSAPYEEWVLVRREEYQRLYMEACQFLANHYECTGEFEQAERLARQMLQVEPWQEEAHRQLMRLLCNCNQRSAALWQYHVCSRILLAELGVEPSIETTALFEAICQNRVPAAHAASTQRNIGEPHAPSRSSVAALPDRGPLLARHNELARLQGLLTKALLGHGRMAFVTGDAGSGKSALLSEFECQARNEKPDLICASSACSALHGVGEPYAPFREILRSLNREIEAGWTEEALASGQTFCEQAVSVLEALAGHRPLLLLLDDLQWLDDPSRSLLFQLARWLEGKRILVVGAYRPADLAVLNAIDRHPLEILVHELRRTFGDLEIDLDLADGSSFVEAFLELEPNRLSSGFRKMLLSRTEGHPLFTIEIVKELKQRGNLVRDETGAWVEGPVLDWDTLPLRVEAAIAERIDRLPLEWQELLHVASVEGDVFTADVLALICGMARNQVLWTLSEHLNRRHRLVRALGLQQFQTSDRCRAVRLFQYSFTHALVRRYLYNQLDEVLLACLHEEVANALAGLCGDHVRQVCPQLDRHAERAGLKLVAAG